MKTVRGVRVALAASLAMAFNAGAALAQELTGTPAPPVFKFTTPMPRGVVVPDSVDTRFGALRFLGGVPDQASTDKICDNLDFQRAVQAYLLGNCSGCREFERLAGQG
jgi:hypothetical protein